MSIKSEQDRMREMYEWHFESVLSELIHEGLITGWGKSEQHSDLDQEGIDYLVVYQSELLVPFQIASSHREAQARRKKNPHIPTVALRRRSNIFELRSQEQVEENIFDELANFISRLPWEHSST